METPTALTSRVGPEEADILARLARETFQETYGGRTDAANLRLYIDTHLTEARLHAELDTPGFVFHMARVAGEPAGYLKTRRDRQPKGIGHPRCLQVERIYVLQRFQGAGIGSALLDIAIRQARTAGDSTVWLQVWRHNQEAIGFYRSKGFCIYETAAFEFGRERTDDYLMRCDIQD
jgi:ribosomal protein S18 acetylase RimI-like enzyme